MRLFAGAGELFEARAYTYDLLRGAYLAWIELVGARSGADGPREGALPDLDMAHLGHSLPLLYVCRQYHYV